ncbi:MAG: type 4a pilus biogenesis protein PilO [bacterium]
MKSLIPFLVIIVCIAAYFLYIGPGISDVNVLRAKLSDYINTSNQSTQINKTRDSIQATLNSIPGEDIAKLDKVVPDTMDSVLLVSDLSTIASRYGMVVRSVQIAEPTENTGDRVVVREAQGPFKVTAVGFTVNGGYDQFIKFLKDLETSARLLDVKTIAIKDSSKTANGTSYDFTLAVNTYSLR